MRPIGHIQIIPLNELIRVQWTHPISYTHMIGWISTIPGDLGQPVDMGNSGICTITNATNGLDYFITLSGLSDSAFGDYSEPEVVTPKADPDAPSGAMMINNGAYRTPIKNVTLNISSSDTPLEGLAQSANAHQGGSIALRYNEVSAGIQMRISNDPAFTGAIWEPLAQEKPWVLAPGPYGTYFVYASSGMMPGMNRSWSWIASNTDLHSSYHKSSGSNPGWMRKRLPSGS